MRGARRRFAGIALVSILAACNSVDSSFEIAEWGVRFQRIPAGCAFFGFESDTGERGVPVARFECGEDGSVWLSQPFPSDDAGRLRDEPTFTGPLKMEWVAPAGDVVYRLEGRSVGPDLLQRFASALESLQP